MSNSHIANLLKAICADFNVKDDIARKCWNEYNDYKQHTLKNDDRGWLAIILFATAYLDSVKKVNGRWTQSCNINITRLSRYCGLNTLSFIERCRKYAELKKLPKVFLARIDKLERFYAVSKILYKKFDLIFYDVFDAPDLNEESNDLKINYRRLKEFSWTLFVYIRSRYPGLRNDLLNSSYLLLAVCDYIYLNCLSSRHADLLNKQFPALPANVRDREFNPPWNPPLSALCIVKFLCVKYFGDTTAVTSVKGVKRFSLMRCIEDTLNREILRGDFDHLVGILEEDMFEPNYTRLNEEYEKVVIPKTNLDERQLILENNPDKMYSPVGMMSVVPCSTLTHVLEHNLLPSREEFLSKETMEKIKEKYKNPYRVRISAETSARRLKKLRLLTSNRMAEPSKDLVNIITSCGPNVLQLIQKHVKNISDRIFARLCTIAAVSGFHCHAFNEIKVIESKILYYRLLENILYEETKISRSRFLALMNLDEFHKTLFSCCTEIVLFSHGMDSAFLWLCQVLDIHPFHFYKIIEVMVRTEKEFSRDIVQHFQEMEDSILDSLAWKEKSPLWDHLKKEGVPSCKSVAITPGSNTLKADVDKFVTLNRTSYKQVVEGEEREGNVPTVTETSRRESNNDNKATTQQKSMLTYFFRKFYNVASIRLFNLYKALRIRSDSTQRRIWTCFEYVVLNHTYLLSDRHLDQILLCCVYATLKALGMGITFQHIVGAHRIQPQSGCHIYRNVLIFGDIEDRLMSAQNANPNQTVTTESLDNCAKMSQSRKENTEEGISQAEMIAEIAKRTRKLLNRGDLIEFYNLIFSKIIHKFVEEITTKTEEEGLVLSPLPVTPSETLSPAIRVSKDHPVFIRELNPKDVSSMRYIGGMDSSTSINIHNSPSSNLQAINSMIKHNFSKNDQNKDTDDEKEREDCVAIRRRNYRDNSSNAKNVSGTSDENPVEKHGGHDATTQNEQPLIEYYALAVGPVCAGGVGHAHTEKCFVPAYPLSEAIPAYPAKESTSLKRPSTSNESTITPKRPNTSNDESSAAPPINGRLQELIEERLKHLYERYGIKT